MPASLGSSRFSGESKRLSFSCRSASSSWCSSIVRNEDRVPLGVGDDLIGAQQPSEDASRPRRID